MVGAAMKRRGFLARLLGVAALPALPSVAASPEHQLVLGEPEYDETLGAVLSDDFQRRYREEFIQGFESHQSLLRDVVATGSVRIRKPKKFRL